MMSGPTAIERAFELARSGQCRSVVEIRKQLKAEGYDSSSVAGKTLFAQLRALFIEAERKRGSAMQGNLNTSTGK